MLDLLDSMTETAKYLAGIDDISILLNMDVVLRSFTAFQLSPLSQN